jgi:hypothetical protein
MTSKEKVLKRERDRGRFAALEVQEKSKDMTGTELNDAEDRIPWFKKAAARVNMLERPVGFVCKSSEGRVVKLLQNYDSTIYTDEPEKLPAQWGFVWSDNPEHAKPFVALSTSPYMIGNCCSEDNNVYRSKIDNNTWSPNTYPSAWELCVDK